MSNSLKNIAEEVKRKRVGKLLVSPHGNFKFEQQPGVRLTYGEHAGDVRIRHKFVFCTGDAEIFPNIPQNRRFHVATRG